MNLDAAVFVLVLTALLAALALFARRHRRRRRSGATASAGAVVLRVWQDGDGPHYVEYRFAPSDGEAVTGVALGGCFRAGLPQPGEHITVLYDPANPHDSFLADESCGTG